MSSDPSMPADFARLAALVAPFLAGLEREHLAGGFSDGTEQDWDSLPGLAERHRVTPALAAAINRVGLVLPATPQKRIDLAITQAAFDELAQAALVRDIVIAFRERDIRLVVLKGIPLSLRLHRRFGMRVSRDIDLLVAPGDVPAALARLMDMGFSLKSADDLVSSSRLRAHMRRCKDIELVHHDLKQVVELHWRLFDNPHLMPLSFPLATQMVMLPSHVACAVLPDRLNVLYLANHGAQHGWSRLKWLIDFAALIAPLGIDGIAAFYDAVSIAEGRRSVAQALILCERLFGWPMPEQVKTDGRRDWRIGAMVRIALRSMTQGGDREMEDVPFGSTAKNIGHYLIRSSPRYLIAEMLFDLTDVSALPAQSPWRRWGAVGRLAAWLGGRGSRRGLAQ